MNELRISYDPDDQWSGKMTIRVASGDFSGAASAWVSANDLDNFAKSLDRYPIPPDQPSRFHAGMGGTQDGRLPPEILLDIAVKPQGVRGDLLVHVELTTEVWTTPDADHRQSVIARFETEYALLERFARQLGGVVAGRIEEAVLEGKAGK